MRDEERKMNFSSSNVGRYKEWERGRERKTIERRGQG